MKDNPDFDYHLREFALTVPHWLPAAMAWFFAAGAITTIAVWGVVWLGVERSVRLVPSLRLGQRLADADPPRGRVCVVIPAHNEARVIAALVRSLRRETYAELRFVLALDRCSDDTAALAHAAIGDDVRFEIIEIDACPTDWAGKVHAVHAGVTRSRAAADADYLLFADADTVFSPGCIAASLALMRHRSIDMLSLVSTLIYKRWFACVVQTASAFELMRRFPLTRVNDRDNPRAFANGQFMLFTKPAYQKIGGHESVRSALLEDLAFARLLRDNGLKVGVFLADGLLCCDMYPDWPQFRRGWKRIYAEAAERRPAKLISRAWRVRWFGTFLPLWALGAGLYGAVIPGVGSDVGLLLVALSLLAAIVWLAALLRISAISRAPAWTAPLHIVGAWITADLLSESARDIRQRKPTHWGGRAYDLGASGPPVAPAVIPTQTADKGRRADVNPRESALIK